MILCAIAKYWLEKTDSVLVCSYTVCVYTCIYICVCSNLVDIARCLTWGQQEDAHEFLRYVVDSMQKSCLAGTNG